MKKNIIYVDLCHFEWPRRNVEVRIAQDTTLMMVEIVKVGIEYV